MDVKIALKDQRFRDSLPVSFKEDLQKYLQNPGCACNAPIYKKIIREAQEQLKQYYPNREVMNLEQDAKKLAENKWEVINCHKDKLEDELKKLPVGRKQIAIARFEEEVTVIVNHLDVLY